MSKTAALTELAANRWKADRSGSKTARPALRNVCGGPGPPLGLTLYADLSEESPLEAGSVAHYQHVVDTARRKLGTLTKGGKVKLARWWAWHEGAEALESTWCLQLLILLWVGLRSGWWRSIEESPLMSRQQAPDPAVAAAAGSAPGGAEPGAEVSPEAPGDELRQLRSTCKPRP